MAYIAYLSQSFNFESFTFDLAKVEKEETVSLGFLVKKCSTAFMSTLVSCCFGF